MARADYTFTDWQLMYKGVEHASGQATVDATTPRQQAVQGLRIDLHDPDIQFFTTPRNPNGTSETLGQNTSLFLKTYGLQVAINANFYSPCCSSPPNSPMNVIGLSVCTGVVVSVQESLTDSANLLITRNNQASIIANNYPPQGTNGIYNAVSGHYVVLANGVNLGFSTPEANTPNPRTAVGISEDGRYLIMMAIDGRQPGWSDGAIDSETADWLIRFGAFNGVNLDGGGSTTMVKADDCDGSALQLNRPVDAGATGRERVIGNNLGVYAKPLPQVVSNVVVAPFDRTATISWQTATPAATQIEYGASTTYGLSLSDPSLTKNHVVTLNNLTPATIYYFRITANVGGTAYTYPCKLQTTNFAVADNFALFSVIKSWKYSTNNLDGLNWQAYGYDDSSWPGGPGLLYIESNTSVAPRNTGLPPTGGAQTTAPVSPTYYFRTHFNFPGNASGVALYFTNWVDDGAVFYLNGTEIQRLRMPAAPALINYTTQATGQPCGGDATCADVFSVAGSIVGTNLISGDNVLAVEVHQYSASIPSIDIVFGSALAYSRPVFVKPNLNILREASRMTIYWNGTGWVLQQATDPAGPWTDVPGPITSSTYVFNAPAGLNFYRLRN